MTPTELRREKRRATVRRAREIVQALSPDTLGEYAVPLIHKLDVACQQKLTAGREDLFGSVTDLFPVFHALVTNCGEDLGLRSTERNDLLLINATFQEFLLLLFREGEVVFVGDRQRARSRAFEIVHYLRHLRQRTHRGEKRGIAPPLVDMIKVEVTKRQRPHRSETIEDMFDVDALDEIDDGEAGEILRLEEGEYFEVEEFVNNAFERFLQKAFTNDGVFPRFQRRAFRQLIRDGLSNEVPRGRVIAAGTGFGKTEAFLLPILYFSCCRWIARGRRRIKGDTKFVEGVNALLLYPRRDLCNNQAERLLGYLYKLNRSLAKEWEDHFPDDQIPPPLRVALAHSGISDAESTRIKCPLCTDGGETTSEDDGAQVPFLVPITEGNGRFSRVVGFQCEREGPAHKEASNLLIPQVKEQSDQADLVITTVDTLHRRLMDEHGRKVIFDSRRLESPRYIVVDEMHIYEGQTGSHVAHIMRRCRQRIRAMSSDPIDPVFVGASATAGDPVDLAHRLFDAQTTEDILIRPGDGPDEVREQGLEYYFFLRSPGNRIVDEPDGGDEHVGEGRRFVSEQATMIQAAMCLSHNMKTPSGAGIHKRRVLGFIDSIDVATRLSRNLDDAEWQDLRNGAGGTRAPLFSLRYPRGRPNVSLEDVLTQAVSEFEAAPVQLGFETPGKDCPKRESRDCVQPPHSLLERCDRYEKGECWYAMGQTGEEGLQPLLIQCHQSGRRAWGDPTRRLDGTDHDRWRLLVTTSALEVGFDHPELIATWQYHAPPSVASFVQRKGRGGRGVRDYPITMVVLGTSAEDIFLFQDHMKLVDVSESDVCSVLDEENPFIREEHLLSALFDFCASRRELHNAFRIDSLDKVVEASRSTDARIWLEKCFSTTSRNDVQTFLENVRDLITRLWNRPLSFDPLPSGRRPSNEVRPPDLFKMQASEILRYDDRLAQEDAASGETKAWLRERLRAETDMSYPVRKVVDFCRFVPDGLSDHDYRIPATTIPVPLGRYISILNASGRTQLGLEPAEFALRYFLPGGFKIRYDGRLWMAPWTSVPDKPREPDSNRIWVATRGNLQTASGDESLPTLKQLLNKVRIDEGQAQDVLGLLGQDCRVAHVESLLVTDLGRAQNRRFSMHDPTKTIVAKRPEDADPSEYISLARDPHISPRFVFIPHDSETTRNVPITGLPGLADNRIRFHERYEITAAFYANLVHCYPSDDDAQTIVLRFWDEQQRCPLAPSLRLRTQSLEFRFRPIENIQLDSQTWVRAFWSRIADTLLERCVVADGILPTTYMVPGVVAVLQLCEPRGSEFLVELSAGQLRQMLTGLSHPANVDRASVAWCRNHVEPIAELLEEAAQWVRERGAAQVVVDSVAAALGRLAARTLNVSPGAFRRFADATQNGPRVLLFDDFEGGSGNTRRLADIWRGSTDLGKKLVMETKCQAEQTDRFVQHALDSDLSPEALCLIASRDQWPRTWPRPGDPSTAGRAVARLKRLVQSPEQAAFNLFVRSEYRRLLTLFGCAPSHLSLLQKVAGTQTLDPRAQHLKMQFLDRETSAANELQARVQELMPLCEGACPECLGGDRYDRYQYVDRDVLRRFLTEPDSES